MRPFSLGRALLVTFVIIHRHPLSPSPRLAAGMIRLMNSTLLNARLIASAKDDDEDDTGDGRGGVGGKAARDRVGRKTARLASRLAALAVTIASNCSVHEQVADEIQKRSRRSNSESAGEGESKSTGGQGQRRHGLFSDMRSVAEWVRFIRSAVQSHNHSHNHGP